MIDTHAHIHFEDYLRSQQAAPAETFTPTAMLKRSQAAGVEHVLCVGTTDVDSRVAVDFVQDKPQCSATVGLHPHDAKSGQPALQALAGLITKPKVVAVGECGLDYYYKYSPKPAQKVAFRRQIELAQKHSKPLIFHVREAFDDFFKIIDNYQGLQGVIHSFSADSKTLRKVLKKGFYVGLNGIMTFTKDQSQLEAAKNVPLEKLLLETDCPFLTPAPKRGTINEPANVRIIAEFLAKLRGEPLETMAKVTTQNAKELFKLV